MDAKSYLMRHGWGGTGTSLHPDKSHALKKPLLISKKVDVLGVGLNKNDAISDQWWMRAFDASLKDFGTGNKGLLGSVKEHGVKRGGLYGRFVKGEGVPGTIGTGVGGTVEPVAGGENTTDGEVRVDSGTEVVGDGSKKRKAHAEDKDGAKVKKSKKTKTEGSDTIVVEKMVSVDGSKHTRKSRRDDSEEQADKARRKAERKKAKRLAKEAAATTASTSQSDITSQLARLDAEKRARYIERAAAKGVNLESYFAKRMLKNQAAAALVAQSVAGG